MSSELSFIAEYRYDLDDADRRTREKYRNYVIKSLQKRKKWRSPKRFRKHTKASKESYTKHATVHYTDIYGNHQSPTFTVDQRLIYEISHNDSPNLWHDYDYSLYHLLDPITYGSDYQYRVESGIAYLTSAAFPVNIGTVGAAPPFDIVFSDDLERSTMQKALSTFGDQKASMGEFFFEREKTLKMMTTAVSRIHRSIIYARRGNFARAFKEVGVDSNLLSTVKSSANAWLELKYGWTPLMSDCLGAAEFIFDKYSDIEKPASHRAFKEVKINHVNTAGLDRQGYPWSVTTTKGLYRCTVVMDGYVSNQPAKDAESLGLANPVNLAWNLLPLSFVADWFVNVDEFLGQFSSGFGLTINRISVTHRIDDTVSSSKRYVKDGPTGVIFRCNSTTMRTRKRRRILYEIPTYPPRMGSFLQNILSKGEFDFKKSISALALAIQRVPK